MFDISLGELAVIGAVSLVVIGPEKLPKVARTVGMLIGRAQRFTANVKADLDREIAQGELAKLEAEIRTHGDELRNSIAQPFSDAKASLIDSTAEARATLSNSSADAKAALLEPTPEPQRAALERAPVTAMPVAAALSPEEEERKHQAEANGQVYVPLAQGQALVPPPAPAAPVHTPPLAEALPQAHIPEYAPPVDERQLDLFAAPSAAPAAGANSRDRR
ncbi:hypothetical protein JCM19000A_35940 [Silvimonas sp. JCM 19000]